MISGALLPLGLDSLTSLSRKGIPNFSLQDNAMSGCLPGEAK